MGLLSIQIIKNINLKNINISIHPGKKKTHTHITEK